MLPTLRNLTRMTTTNATSSRPQALLFGLGAIGSVYATILKRSGKCDVSVVARSNYAAVKDKGLRLESEKFGVVESKFDHGECGEGLGRRGCRGGGRVSGRGRLGMWLGCHYGEVRS